MRRAPVTKRTLTSLPRRDQILSPRTPVHHPRTRSQSRRDVVRSAPDLNPGPSPPQPTPPPTLHGSGRSRVLAAWLSILLLAASIPAVWDRGSAAPTALGAQVQAVGSFATSDPLLGPVRGSVDQILSYAQEFGSQRMPDLEAYLAEVYLLAPLVGLDPAVVVAQSNLETDTWRTGYWREHLNPAGIGIIANGAPSFTWANGTDAARGQIVHLYLYAVGVIPAGHPLEPYKALDPRYQAAINAGYAGIARTVGDLTGRWAVDPNYGEKLSGRGNDMFVKLRIGGAAQSSGSSAAYLAEDGSLTTAWATTTSPPPNPSFAWFDLGGVVSFGSIRWVFAETGLADQMDVQVSNDLAAWTTLGTFGNAPAGSWQNLEITASGRYLRFVFHNPNRDPKLGSLAEIQLWPPTTAPLPWLPPATPPDPYVPGTEGAPIATLTPTPRPPTPTPIPGGALGVTLSTDRTTVNVSLGATFTGFAPGQAVEIQWKGVTKTTAVANQFGSGFAAFPVPAAPIGTYAIRAVGGGRSASATFTIAPRIKVTPSPEERGATVDVSLRGFGKKETVRIRWRRGTGYVDVATVFTSNTGSANIDVTVPEWATDGPAAIRGDGPVARAQTNIFVVSGGSLAAAEAASPVATIPETVTPTATTTQTATPDTTGSPDAVATPDGLPIDPSPTPPAVPTETPAIVETATPEPTATEIPSPEPTPTAPSGTPDISGTPTDQI